MARFTHSNQFVDFIINNNLEVDEYDDNIKKLNGTEKLINIVIVGVVLYWAISLFLAKNGSDAFLFLFFTSLIPVFLLVSLYNSKSNQIGIIDNKIFTSYLSKKLQIFYQNDSTENLKYDVIKHTSAKTKNSANINQAIIDICYEAIDWKAQGVIITNRNSTSVTSGSIKKGKGDISTDSFQEAEAILVKNIKESEVKISSNTDLNYWHDLKQKGIITEDEFSKKKNELLSFS